MEKFVKLMIGSLLIVDDNSRRAAWTFGGLEGLPFASIEARSGEEAMKKAREQNIDLVLMRAGMGVEIFHELAAISERAGMFIALMMERGLPEELRKSALELNADGFINEEAGEDEKVAIVSALLRRKRAMDALRQSCGGGTGGRAESWRALRPLRERLPELHREVLRRYEEGVKLVLQNRIYKMDDDVFEPFRQIARELFQANATARDAVELHYQTLRKIAPTADAPGAQAYLEVGRTTIIGLMGDLITCYREAGRNQNGNETSHRNGAQDALNKQAQQ